MTHPNLQLCALLVAAGIVGHFLKKLYDLEQSGTILSPITFWRLHPYQVLVAIAGAYLLMAFLYFVGQLNEVSALLVGVLCSDSFDTLRARAVGRLKDAAEEGGPR